MKIALVLDWPSIDAAPGHPLSEWEWKVTQELMQAATFKPDYVGTAFRAYTAKWPTLFTDNKPGKLQVWFLRGDVVLWEEQLDWPGY